MGKKKQNYLFATDMITYAENLMRTTKNLVVLSEVNKVVKVKIEIQKSNVYANNKQSKIKM
jgi:hypothetical protein